MRECQSQTTPVTADNDLIDTVGLIIWPVKIVPEMTYNVSSGTLSLYTTTVTWWSGLGGIQALPERPTGFLQCFDTVGLVIWPVKIVPDMTYVFVGTLNLAQSINHCFDCGVKQGCDCCSGTKTCTVVLELQLQLIDVTCWCHVETTAIALSTLRSPIEILRNRLNKMMIIMVVV